METPDACNPGWRDTGYYNIDWNTGFIMESNPWIAHCGEHDPDADFLWTRSISWGARKQCMEDNFSFEKTVEKWEKIIRNIE